MAGTWAPYTGVEAILLAVVLLAVAAVFLYAGLRLKAPIALARPGRAVSGLLILIWVVSIAAFIIDAASYGWVLEQSNLVAVYKSYTAPNPVTPVTELGAVATFVIILLLTRKHGIKVSLLSAFVGAVSAPLIFELPFDLIVWTRIYPSIPPYPNLFRSLFFLPLILVELSTLSFLAFSPLTRMSKYTFYSMAAFFFVFAVWGALGFAYPSDLVDEALNDIGKLICFAVAITFYFGPWVSAGGKAKGQAEQNQPPKSPAPLQVIQHQH